MLDRFAAALGRGRAPGGVPQPSHAQRGDPGHPGTEGPADAAEHRSRRPLPDTSTGRSQSLFGKQRLPALALFLPVCDPCQPLGL
jgi:hypothetical protein